jgi:hypothetical protein
MGLADLDPDGARQGENEWKAKPSDYRSENIRGEEPNLAHTVLA